MKDTIYRQAAIDAVHKSIFDFFDICDDDEESPMTYQDKRLLEINKAITTQIKAVPSAQPEQQWIPCSERLPEETRKSYWICTDAGYQCECRWTNINHLFTDLTMKWHWHIMDVPQYDSVVAWMPLPEPYGGEQE